MPNMNTSKIISSIADCDLCADSSSSSPKSWFVVFTVPRHEKRVAEHCRIRGIENFLPLFHCQRQWKDGSKGLLQLPLFSRYIFVRIGCGGRMSVLELPGVISIVGNARNSWPIPDSYIRFLREGLSQRKIEPHPYLTTGVRVRICSGTMVGMEGVLVRNKNNFRVVVTIEMIMKSVRIEVAVDEIEPVGRSHCMSDPGLWPELGLSS
jgi:transcription antitermination factor NusG